MKKIYFCLILTILISAACSRQNGANTENGALAESTAATPTTLLSPTAVPTRTPAPTTTPTATPEPLGPTVIVEDQALGEDGRLTIDRVVITETGWLVIHELVDGVTGVVLGYTAVAEGSHEDVEVTVDPLQVTETLLVALYPDSEAGDEDEFPGAILPDGEGALATAAFIVDVQIAWPTLVVSDQEVLDDGLVRITTVSTAGPGWLLIQADDGGLPGPTLGKLYLEEGLNENLTVAIDWRQATPRLHAALYHDAERSGRFDAESDLPLIVRGRPLATYFDVTLPYDIFILNQPVVNGSIIIDRVISNGPGWVAISFDDSGRPGRIIGQAFLEDGLNEFVVVPILERFLTSTLFAALHEDTGTIGEFEFPRADPQILYHDRMPEPIPFRIDSGNYLVARDQPVGVDDTVIIPLVVVNRDAWVVVYNVEGGEPAAIIGQTWIPAGINRDVIVAVDSALTADTLTVMLHLDDGEPQQFEPDDTDLPLTHNRQVIMAPFELIDAAVSMDARQNE